MKRIIGPVVLFLLGTATAVAQTDRWQQHVKYQMDIAMDANSHRLTGKQQLAYTNNSPIPCTAFSITCTGTHSSPAA